MSDIKTLHKTARTLILNLRDGLEQLERSENVSDQLASLCFQALLSSVPDVTGTALWCCNWSLTPAAAKVVGPAKD